MDLMRRMPPGQIQEDLAGVLSLVPDLVEDLLSAVDQPLKEAHDPVANKKYLLCDYNRDGDSYRSPWTNRYDPPLEDGVAPPEDLRQLEVAANEAFDQYREQYFEGGSSSAYFWESDTGFACCVVLKNDGTPANPGSWNSIHVVDAAVNEKDKTASYSLVTTIMLSLSSSSTESGNTNLAGNLTRREERRGVAFADMWGHLANIGDMIEKMEVRMRETLSEVYFGKTQEVVEAIRSTKNLKEDGPAAQQRRMMEEMMKRKAAK